MKIVSKSIQISILCAGSLLCSLFSEAQVGIGSSSPNVSTALDISSSDKGFLMTQVALTGTNDLTTITPYPTTGLLVYNTAEAGSPGVEVVPGFYYFNGTSWRRFFTQGYSLSFNQTAEVTASSINTEYTILPGLDTGNFTVPFTGTYQIRVEGYYSAGDLISTSGDGAAQGSLSLAIASRPALASGCAGGITTYPYSESFESGLGAWTQSGADDRNWSNNSGPTGSGGTGPSSASNGTDYMYIEASGSGTGFPNRQAILNSPCFDLTSLSVAAFNFDYHMLGTSMGSLALEISNDNGSSWNLLWSQSGNQGNTWFSESVSLSDYVGSSVQLRFNGITGSSWSSDIAIDNLSLTQTNVPSVPLFNTIKETYLTTSSKQLGGTTVNNLAQSGTILVNIDLNAGTTYRFAVRGREWLANNTNTGIFGKDTSGYAGNSLNNAQRGTMTISLISQL